MPESVSPISCSRVSGLLPGRMLTLVMRMMGSRFQPSARSVPPERLAPIVCAVSRELRYPVNKPLVMIGVHCAGTPSSSKANVPRPGPCSGRASATTFTKSVPYRRFLSLSRVRKDVPAKLASMPNTRSSSIGWPMDSWICRASCELSRMMFEVPSGHRSDFSSATASSPTRRAFSTSFSSSTSS